MCMYGYVYDVCISMVPNAIINKSYNILASHELVSFSLTYQPNAGVPVGGFFSVVQQFRDLYSRHLGLCHPLRSQSSLYPGRRAKEGREDMYTSSTSKTYTSLPFTFS